MKTNITLSLLLFISISSKLQTDDSLYLEYQNIISISQMDNMIYLSFKLKDTNLKTTTYTFWIDNNPKEFDEIKNQKEMKFIKHKKSAT